MTDLNDHGATAGEVTSSTAALETLLHGSAQGAWVLDPADSRVEFDVKHLWGLTTVHGRFSAVGGEATVGPDGDVTARIVIEARSLDTGHDKRDTHLRSKDFFDVAEHPHVILAVTSARLIVDGHLAAQGSLEAGGRTQPISFTARIDRAGVDGVLLRAQLVVDRFQFDMRWRPLLLASKRVTARMVAHFVRP